MYSTERFSYVRYQFVAPIFWPLETDVMEWRLHWPSWFNSVHLCFHLCDNLTYSSIWWLYLYLKLLLSTSDSEFLLLTCNLFIYMYYYLCKSFAAGKQEMGDAVLHCIREIGVLFYQSWYLQHNWCFLCESFQLTCLRCFSLSLAFYLTYNTA